MTLTVGMLGPVWVGSPDGVVAIRRPAQRRLLSILALAGGARVSTDQLIDRFWSHAPPATARAAIQTHVSGLRRGLTERVVVTEGFGYRLNLSDHELDVATFTSLSATATDRVAARDWETGLATLESALVLWRGDPYAELADDDFARPEIARLKELHLEILEMRAECFIGLGREQEVLPELEALVIEHPHRERMWEHLMTARYRLGRHTEALQAFQLVSDHLAEIGVEPGLRLRQLEERILLHDQSLIQTRNNLPTDPDTFIGRERELADIARLISESRLVTLTGAGGSGKTRLALQSAQLALDRFPDGVWFVELADLDDPALIPTEIATVMGLPLEGDLMPVLERTFSTKHSLVILDNCEHVTSGAGEVAKALLLVAPQVTFLATSRQPLRTAGEHLFQVPGLALPEDVDTQDLVRSDSVRLFEQRALQADPAFDVEADLRGVVEICRRLDAMPLGIELAAARVSSLGVDEIEKHLGRSLGFLTSGNTTAHPRHQTLEATIGWSYRLASDEVREALALLSMFRGGFNLEMATWMLGDDAPRLVAELVDQSLVTTYQGARGRRYRILETIRQFGMARAAEDDVSEMAFRAHADWCVSFADHVWGSWQKPHFDRVELAIHEEFENLTAAYERADTSGDRVLAGRVAEGLLWHWDILGHLQRALELFNRALETCSDDDRRVGLLAKAVWPKFYTNKLDEAFADAETAYRLAKELEPSEATAYAVSTKAAIFGFRPDLDGADGIPFAKEAVDIAKETGNELLVAVLELDLALALGWAGLTDEAGPALERAVDLVERTGDPPTVAYTYFQAVTVAMQIADMRREALGDYSARLLEWLDEHPHFTPRFRMGWVEWAMIQAGNLAEIESQLREWSRENHLEGFLKVENLVPLGIAVWMQGRLEEAVGIIEDCEAEGVHPRWYHDFYPLKVDVLVDLGQLDGAEAAAAVYLEYETHPTESAKKLGVLNPLVRGVANLAEHSADRAALVSRAKNHVDRMRQILAEHPPPMDGSVAMETHTTHLLFAEAELTRLTNPDPAAWTAAMSAADFTYFRLYAQIRLGEALIALGQRDDGMQQLEEGFEQARHIGASRLASLAEATISG